MAAFGATGAGARRRPSEEPLLGSVDRPGIGRQVTYAGHPLYLFDGPAALFQPYGEDYPETGAPMEPWHGVWYLVSAHGGQPAPGRATIETGALPDGKMVVAAQEFPNVSPTAVTVYSFSRDHGGRQRLHRCLRGHLDPCPHHGDAAGQRYEPRWPTGASHHRGERLGRDPPARRDQPSDL